MFSTSALVTRANVWMQKSQGVNERLDS
jgi:hypothetical protein